MGILKNDGAGNISTNSAVTRWDNDDFVVSWYADVNFWCVNFDLKQLKSASNHGILDGWHNSRNLSTIQEPMTLMTYFPGINPSNSAVLDHDSLLILFVYAEMKNPQIRGGWGTCLGEILTVKEDP